MTDFGADLRALPDLDPLFEWVTGRAVLVEAVARRFQTPRGALFYDPDYGLDLTAWVQDSVMPADVPALQSAAAAECRKDERVLAAIATARFDPASRTLGITLRLIDASGPFDLVLAVDRVSVRVLNAQQGSA